MAASQKHAWFNFVVISISLVAVGCFYPILGWKAHPALGFSGLFGRVRDPFGHEWGITTRLHDMTPDEIQAAAAKLFESMAD